MNKENKILNEELTRIKNLMGVNINESVTPGVKIIDDIIEYVILFADRNANKEIQAAGNTLESKYSKNVKPWANLVDSEKDEVMDLIKIVLKDKNFKTRVIGIIDDSLGGHKALLDKQLIDIVTDFKNGGFKNGIPGANNAMILSVESQIKRAKNQVPELGSILDEIAESYKTKYLDELASQIGKAPTLLNATSEAWKPFTEAFGPALSKKMFELTDSIYAEATKRLLNTFSKSIQTIFTGGNKNYPYKLIFKDLGSTSTKEFGKKVFRFMLTGSTEDLWQLLKGIAPGGKFSKSGFMRFIGTYAGAAYRRYFKLFFGLWILNTFIQVIVGWKKLGITPNQPGWAALLEGLGKTCIIPHLGWAVPFPQIWSILAEVGVETIVEDQTVGEALDEAIRYFQTLEQQQAALTKEVQDLTSRAWVETLNTVITMDLMDMDSDESVEILKAEFGDFGYKFVGSAAIPGGFFEGITITRPDGKKKYFDVDNATKERDRVELINIKRFMSSGLPSNSEPTNTPTQTPPPAKKEETPPPPAPTNVSNRDSNEKG